MPTLVKRNQIRAFLNTTPEESNETWSVVGNRQTSGVYSYDATETDETYIVDEGPTTIIDRYKLSMDNEMKCYFGDAVFNFVNKLRRNLAIGTAAETSVLLIDTYDAQTEAQTTSYVAQKFKCTVSISGYGGDGGETPTISYKISMDGDPINGTATINSSGVPTFVPAV